LLGWTGIIGTLFDTIINKLKYQNAHVTTKLKKKKHHSKLIKKKKERWIINKTTTINSQTYPTPLNQAKKPSCGPTPNTCPNPATQHKRHQ